MAEVLHGDGNGNQLNARTDKTQVYGLKGNDTMTADGKRDVLLVGGSGDDSLIMSGGNGTLSGGKGSDTFELTYSATKPLSAVIEDLEPSSDKIVVNFDGNTVPTLNTVTSGSDVILRDGTRLNVTLKGVRENDYFDGDASDEAWEVLKLTNAERERQNLPALTMADGLTAGAAIRAEEITSLGMSGILTDHKRPDGTDFSTLLNGKYNYPGENLDAGAESPVQVMRDWIGSTAHFANIINPNFQKLGVAYNYNDEDPAYQKWYWAQLFAESLKSPETIGTTDLLNAKIDISASPKLITLSDNPDNYTNASFGATVKALGGNDTINNAVLNVTIDGGADNDQISLAASSENNLIQYAAGDGNDTVRGFNADDTLSITGGEYTRSTVGNDIVFTVDTGSVRLVDAKSLATLNIDGTRNKFIVLNEDDDIYQNTIESATIAALGGNDTIENGQSRGYEIKNGKTYIYRDIAANDVSINCGAGDDSISNVNSDNVTIYAGEGDDYVYNSRGSNVTIDAGNGNNSIRNWSEGANITINSGAGDDSISNDGSNVLISVGDGNNSIDNSGYDGSGKNVSIYAGAGNDSISNDGSNVLISVGDGNNSIRNGSYDDRGKNVSIYAGAGDDSISNDGSNVLISVGDGNNSISNWREATNVTINSGAGDDSVYSRGSKVVINVGEGKDFIQNGVAHWFSYDGTVATSYDSVDGGDSVSISGGASNDTIYSMGSKVTINGGRDNDIISLASYSKNNLIEYSAGDGRDSVWSFDGNDTLKIGDGKGTYSTQISGNDFIVKVGVGSVTLVDAASLAAVKIVGVKSTLENYLPITLTEDADTYSNDVESATILALGGNDFIANEGLNVSINGGADSDSIINSTINVIIDGDAGNDIISNVSDNVTISGGADNDSINNSGSQVSIEGSADNDTLLNSGSNVSIGGGRGDDSISLTSDAQNNFIQYSSGDGNDIVRGFKATDTLHLLTSGYVRSTVGNDILFTVGDGSIKLSGVTSLPSFDLEITAPKPSDENKLFALTNEDDSYYNIVDGATIAALGGNDSIYNGHYNRYEDERIAADNVSIDAGAGNDYIFNWRGHSVTVDGGLGNDTLSNIACNSITLVGGTGDDSLKHAIGSSVSMDGGDGNDYIEEGNDSDLVTIDGGNGDDTISNNGDSVTINAGDGNDTIDNEWASRDVQIDAGSGDDIIDNAGSNVTIIAGDGDDSISSGLFSSNVQIEAGAGDDSIENVWGTDSITIDAGAGDDTIENSGNNATINGGEGNDSISNNFSSLNDYNKVTINAGTGDDTISLAGRAGNIFIEYTTGDGNDSIWGLDDSSTLNISTEMDSSVESGDDIIIYFGEGSITLKDAREKPPHIILGSSGTSGGGSNSGNGNSASGAGNGGGSSSGGTNAGGSGSSGSSGNGGSIGDGSGISNGISSGAASSGTNAGRGSSGGSSSNVSSGRGNDGGNGTRRNSHSTTANAPTVTTSPAATNTLTAQSTTQQTTATAQYVYAGGNQVIANYTSGEKIIFGATYTGAFYDGNGNFFAGSTTGALVVQNAADKVIDLRDAAGNAFVKAYSATTAGVIDGRGLLGFEVINGSAGSDAIYAGDGGSQLWGGADTVSDAMMGGNGTDIFIGGKNQGADFFLNASSADIVHLNDTTLSDIVATAEENGTIGIAFNTGNVVAVQSSEALSATVMLADGSAYRFNHANKSWQTA